MLTSTLSAILAFATVGLAVPAAQPSFTAVPHAFPTPQTNYQLVYRGPDNLHCNPSGPSGYHYNVTVFNPEIYLQYSACKNLYNPARAFQIGVKQSDDQLSSSRYDVNGEPGNYRRPVLLFYTEPNCQGQPLGSIPEAVNSFDASPPPGPVNSTYGTCYESSQLARSAELLITTVNAG